MLKPMYVYKVTQDSFLEQEYDAEVGFYRNEKDAIEAARKRAEFLASDNNSHKLSTLEEFEIEDKTEIEGCFIVKEKYSVEDERYRIYISSVEVF